MQTTTKHTTDNLQKLNERLAVIDNAQKNITDLASQVTSLQSVLANKQARGAFGQGRMEAIIQDGLPKGAYEFQFTLSNGTRPDCCVFLPDQRPLVIDAKFPLEGVTAFREAKTDDERKIAAQRLRQDVSKHVTDIAEKYLIPGETQDMALMFVPSESVYAEIARRLRRHGAEGLSRPGRDGVAVAADAGDPGDAADPEGRAHARGRRPDPRRGRPPDGRCRPARATACASCSSISTSPTRTSGRSSISAEKIEKRGDRIRRGRIRRPMDEAQRRASGADCASSRRGGISIPGAMARARPIARRMPRMTAAAETSRAEPLARGARGLSQAARADRAVPRLLRRPAARAVGLDAAGLDARGRRRSRHHRPVRAGRHALHHQVPVGAGGRCARRAGAVAAARPPARLAGAVATPADGRDRLPRALRSENLAAGRGGRRARCWSPPPRRPRTS